MYVYGPLRNAQIENLPAVPAGGRVIGRIWLRDGELYLDDGVAVKRVLSGRGGGFDLPEAADDAEARGGFLTLTARDGALVLTGPEGSVTLAGGLDIPFTGAMDDLARAFTGKFYDIPLNCLPGPLRGVSGWMGGVGTATFEIWRRRRIARPIRAVGTIDEISTTARDVFDEPVAVERIDFAHPAVPVSAAETDTEEYDVQSVTPYGPVSNWWVLALAAPDGLDTDLWRARTPDDPDSSVPGGHTMRVELTGGEPANNGTHHIRRVNPYGPDQPAVVVENIRDGVLTEDLESAGRLRLRVRKLRVTAPRADDIPAYSAGSVVAVNTTEGNLPLQRVEQNAVVVLKADFPNREMWVTEDDVDPSSHQTVGTGRHIAAVRSNRRTLDLGGTADMNYFTVGEFLGATDGSSPDIHKITAVAGQTITVPILPAPGPSDASRAAFSAFQVRPQRVKFTAAVGSDWDGTEGHKYTWRRGGLSQNDDEGGTVRLVADTAAYLSATDWNEPADPTPTPRALRSSLRRLEVGGDLTADIAPGDLLRLEGLTDTAGPVEDLPVDSVESTGIHVDVVKLSSSTMEFTHILPGRGEVRGEVAAAYRRLLGKSEVGGSAGTVDLTDNIRNAAAGGEDTYAFRFSELAGARDLVVRLG